jgi:glycosyltransferase involved in cell wall biosynthesis
MNLTLVIPTHNRNRELATLLNSLFAQSIDDLLIELIIVSNLPEPQLEHRIKDLEKQSKYSMRYFCTGKVGVNLARNLGLSKARSQKIYFLDDDVVLTNSEHLKLALALAEKNPEFAAIGGSYNLPRELDLIDEVYHTICTSWLKERADDSKKMVYLLGGNTLYNRELLADQLKFNEQITFGGAETELNLRLHMAGHHLLFHDSLNLEHATHLNSFSLIKKAIRQGMGRSFHEQIVPKNFWTVDTTNPHVFLEKLVDQKIMYFFANCYLFLYDFFFHVGYRHGKKENNGPLSWTTIVICSLQTFFQVKADEILFIPNPKVKPFHQQTSPSFKFRELYHWLKGNIWWKIPNYLFWRIMPFVGAIAICAVGTFFPFNSIGLRTPYNRLFDAIENFIKRNG